MDSDLRMLACLKIESVRYLLLERPNGDRNICFLSLLYKEVFFMNRELLIEEAKLQEAALKRLGHWAAIGMAVSSVGVVLIYFAVVQAEKRIWLIVLGTLILILGASAVITIGLGIRNGRNNVQKILRAIEQDKTPGNKLQDKAPVNAIQDNPPENEIPEAGTLCCSCSQYSEE